MRNAANSMSIKNKKHYILPYSIIEDHIWEKAHFNVVIKITRLTLLFSTLSPSFNLIGSISQDFEDSHIWKMD